MILEIAGATLGTAAVMTPATILLMTARKERRTARQAQRMAALETHLKEVTSPKMLTIRPKVETSLPMPKVHPAILAAMTLPPGPMRIAAMDRAMRVIQREEVEKGNLPVTAIEPGPTEPSRGLMQVIPARWSLPKEQLKALAQVHRNRQAQMTSMFGTKMHEALEEMNSLPSLERPKTLALMSSPMTEPVILPTKDMPYAGPPTMELAPITVDFEVIPDLPTKTVTTQPETKPTKTEISRALMTWLRTGKKPSKKIMENLAPPTPMQEQTETTRQIPVISLPKDQTKPVTISSMQVRKAAATSAVRPSKTPPRRVSGQVTVQDLGLELNGRWHRGQHRD